MRPDDLALLRVPGPPAVHGPLVLTGITRPDPERDTYRGELLRVPLDGGAPRAWTTGRDTAPRISPDGRWVVFLRTVAPGEKPQLYLAPTDGGEPRPVTDLPGGAGPAVWAPDSRRVAFTARVPEPGRDGTGPRPGPDAQPPRVITRLDYRFDDVDFLVGRRSRLFVLDVLAAVDDATAGSDRTGPERAGLEPLTSDRYDVSDPAWSADGAELYLIGPHGFDEGPETTRLDVIAVPSAGGAPRLLATGPGRPTGLLTVDTGRVAFLSEEFDGEGVAVANLGLWLLDVTGSGTPVRLTDEETVNIATVAAGPPGPAGPTLLITVTDRGTVPLCRVPVPPPGGTPEQLTLAELDVLIGGRLAVTGAAEHGGRVVASAVTETSPGEVLLVEPDGRVRTLTDLAAPLRAGVGDSGGPAVLPLRALSATAPDGYPVHGWLVRPDPVAHPGPRPVLLVVHGGPYTQYTWGFFDEAQTYAGAGYAVVLANPRGSAGYGQAHGRAIVGAIGTVDADDLLALLDAALGLDEPDADPLDADRVGVMGGSYGGLMTTWLAAHHGHRFRAAWSERAVNDWEAFTGTSDIGWWFARAYCGDEAGRRRASPLTHADRIRIPFSVVHSEHDWRCPVGQAQALFTVLRRNGVDTQLILFPGEGHELSRSGSPRHRQQRLELVLDWWERHLGKPSG